MVQADRADRLRQQLPDTVGQGALENQIWLEGVVSAFAPQRGPFEQVRGRIIGDPRTFS
jgi:hypothetical protein